MATVLTERVDPAVVLDAAKAANLRTVIVIGTTKQGKPYRAASDGNATTLVSMLDDAANHIEETAEDA